MPSVVAQHIQLYVNDYTIALDERAVLALLDWQQEQGVELSRPILALTDLRLTLTFYFLLFRCRRLQEPRTRSALASRRW